MTNKLTYIFLSAFSICIMAKAQQTPSFTEYNYNPFLLNPAYAGVEKDPEATLSNIGFGSPDFQGAPRSLAFTFNTHLRNKRMGLGLSVLNDEIGVTSATQIYGSYSYKIILNENSYPYWKVYDRSFISFGLNVGALIYNQDLLGLGIQDDPSFSENVNTILPSFGAGVLFGHANFFAGVSALNLLGDALSNQNNLQLSQPFYAYGGYHFLLNNVSSI